MRELKHLSEIFENYDTFVIDLWGVMHNGVVLNSKAIDAINQLKNNAKKIVFLSNAPRPSFQVVNFLKSGGRFYFQSGVCMKTERTALGRSTYVGNKWLHFPHRKFAR